MISRKKRTWILINGSSDLPARMCREIEEKYRVVEIDKPDEGLVLLKVRETAKQSLFYLGEVLVTETRVQIQEKIGIGIVQGHNPELSYQMAVIDGAYNASLPEVERWSHLLKDEEIKIQYNHKKEENDLSRTKVNFETMEEENPYEARSNS
jgi:alpha-D-ribose 1-methylphosphonate 5-triphosphate synthase subunit PhnG